MKGEHTINSDSACTALSKKITTWEQLRQRLGHPQTILCLGNGPSSESQDVWRASFDCLFRVNWQWHARGRLASPSVVFTADPDTPPITPVPIICFPTAKDASRVLSGYASIETVSASAHFVFTELPSPINDRSFPHQPTNGALMIAAAVSLQPRRLIVAGIDLYRHPAGRYPGDDESENEYDAMHDRAVDCEVIRCALAQSNATVEILSEQLRSILFA